MDRKQIEQSLRDQIERQEHKPYSEINYDKAAGIHYGVISSGAVNSDALEDIYSNGTDLGWENYKRAVKEQIELSLKSGLDSYLNDAAISNAIDGAWEAIEDDLGDNYESCEPASYWYESDGYKILLGSDGDMFVEKSPLFTMAAPCSPCAPNAGYMMNAGSLKTYCLGAEWFEDKKAPFATFSVETGELLGDSGSS